MIPKDSAEDLFSIIDPLEFCSHCGLRNNPGDSFTMHEDGRIVRCQHWPPIKQVCNEI